MLQRILCLICCCFFLVSCEFFQKKELPQDALTDTIIDFNSVDVFPLFAKCDSIPSLQKQKLCTQIKLSEYMYAALSSVEIVTSRKVNDTLFIRLRINRNGKASLAHIKASEFLRTQIPTIDTLIEFAVEELPELKPAIKRGIPVATELTLPVIIVN